MVVKVNMKETENAMDNENKKKDIEKLDIEIPVLTPRIFREYKNLAHLEVAKFKHKKIKIKEFSDEELKEIFFKYVVSKEEDETHHKTVLDTNSIINYQGAIGFFTQSIMKELRLISGYDILYEKVKMFIQNELFDKKVNLEDLNILRNLSEIESTRTIIETFSFERTGITFLLSLKSIRLLKPLLRNTFLYVFKISVSSSTIRIGNSGYFSFFIFFFLLTIKYDMNCCPFSWFRMEFKDCIMIFHNF